MPPPARNDAAARAPAKPEPAPEPAPAAAAAPRPAGLKAWLPVLAAILLAPAATWGTVEYVLLPRLQKRLALPTTEPAAVAAESSGEKGKEGKGKEGGAAFEFQNQVVNLSGTMGTRYLKTNVHVVGTDQNLKSIFEGSKPKLTDVTQSVLSSLTLADLEEPGAKNVIRAKLVLAYNQALNRKLVEEVYLTDFVLQ